MQPCSRAHCSTSRCPPSATYPQTRTPCHVFHGSTGSLLPRPLQQPPGARSQRPRNTFLSFHGQSCALNHCNASKRPPSAAAPQPSSRRTDTRSPTPKPVGRRTRQSQPPPPSVPSGAPASGGRCLRRPGKRAHRDRRRARGSTTPLVWVASGGERTRRRWLGGRGHINVDTFYFIFPGQPVVAGVINIIQLEWFDDTSTRTAQ